MLFPWILSPFLALKLGQQGVRQALYLAQITTASKVNEPLVYLHCISSVAPVSYWLFLSGSLNVHSPIITYSSASGKKITLIILEE